MAQDANSSAPLSTFLSRPDLRAPALNVSIQEGFSAGYIFIAPYQTAQTAPYIYDKFGNLVWSGYGSVGPGNSHDFKVCSYRGADHLCLHQGHQLLGYSRGHGLILNNQYKVVDSVEIGGAHGAADLHEFTLLNGGESALLISYQPVPYDLSAYGVTTGQGWIMDGVFQEINLTTREVLFEWRALDHVSPADSYVLPNTTEVSGTGLSSDSPWDYFHINSVEKSEVTGNYLISVRHTSALYHIDGRNGNIIWQLSADGKSDYALQNFNFSYQHDARFLSENETTTVISFFDNGSNGYNQTSSQSRALIVALNNVDRTAIVIGSASAPLPNGLNSASQANAQVLPNGNIFIGWGNRAYVSEHAPDGRALLFAQFATIGTMNYRAYSFEWDGNPATPPALYAYSRTPSTPTLLAVSWNGATEVASWRFYGGASPSEPLQPIGTAEKRGFETRFTAAAFHAYTSVEALDANGVSLANSTVQRTFVPGAAVAQVCDDVQCPVATAYSTPTPARL